MHTDFRNFTVNQDSYNHAYTETLETIRIDLSNYVNRLSKKYVDMLIPPSAGVYLNAHINPFLTLATVKVTSVNTPWRPRQTPRTLSATRMSGETLD